MEDKGTALGWDDEAKVQDNQYEVLPEGVYTYEVVNFKREHFDGSDKMSPCPVAVLQLKCTNQATGITGTSFFKSCSLLDPNAAEGSNMPMSLFNNCVGCTGTVKVKVSKSTKGGKTYENNEFNFGVPKGGTPAQTAPAQKSWGGEGF